MRFNIIRHSTLWLGISGALLAAGIVCIAVFGLNPGIDFTGGALLNVQLPDGTAQETVRRVVTDAGYAPLVQTAGDGSMLIRVAPIDEEQHQKLLSSLQTAFGEVTERQYSAVGPTIGAELKKKATVAVILVLALVAGYVAWAFRRVSEPVRSWKYGVVTLIAALHDVVIPLGVFAVLGAVLGYEANTAFIAALLTILGYSINDTIVVFDRTRENLYRYRHSDTAFADTVNTSLNETLGRSLLTTMTTLFPVIAIAVFGGESTRPFAVTLLVGIVSGAYSSLFVAGPLLVLSEKWGRKDPG